jgi:hypothetical protein
MENNGLAIAALGDKIVQGATVMVLSRSGDCVVRHLKGYTGILQVDGYSAYTRLAKTGNGASHETVTLAGCWAHLRRRFDGSMSCIAASQWQLAPCNTDRHNHGRALEH